MAQGIQRYKQWGDSQGQVQEVLWMIEQGTARDKSNQYSWSLVNILVQSYDKEAKKLVNKMEFFVWG